jgi:hypothetical protein
LRALGKLDFARLGNVAAPLMVRTARRAFEFLGRYDALRRAGAHDAGAVVLQRINRDYPMLTLEVVLEALTISGRLPPYEAIVVALNGGPSRERGFAVETVAQASGRTLERLLAPWIAGWTPERQLAYARQHRLLPEMSKRESLDRSLTSSFPLEAAAAAQALWERGEPQHLAAKLRELPHPILADTLRILEARAAGDGDVGEMTPVECVEALMAAAQLRLFNFTHLEWLAPSLKAEAIGADTVLAAQGSNLDCAWVVVAGSAMACRDAETQCFMPGAVVSMAALSGQRISCETVVAGEGLRAIALPTALVLECGVVFSELGLELLRLRVAG